MGAEKFALITGVSPRLAEILLQIYGALFPEIKTHYHSWVEKQIRTTKTIWMPEPVRFRKVFHSINSYSQLDDNTLRSACSCYPQCTIGALLVRTLGYCSRIFACDLDDKLADQWKTWYGDANWDAWRTLRDSGLRTPQAILWGGMDVRLNLHDAGVMSVPDYSCLLSWAARTWKMIAEVPIIITPGKPENNLIVPVEFKVGKTLAAEDMHDFELVV